jgi:hypothetical protein
MSKSGKKRHQEGKLTNFTFDWTGRKHSEETKKKMSMIKKKCRLRRNKFTIWYNLDYKR